MSTAAGDPIGGPAEEARRLVEALGDWASTRLGTAEAHIATGSAECQVCPICAVISALRGDHGEVVARLGEAWSVFLGVLTAHGHRPDPTAASSPDSADSAEAPVHQSVPDVAALVRSVQNIDVG